MDELAMIEHFIAVGREISEIRAANRAYWTRRVHNRLEKELHGRRRQRLEKITNVSRSGSLDQEIKLFFANAHAQPFADNVRDEL